MTKLTDAQYIALLGYSDDSEGYEDFELEPARDGRPAVTIRYRGATPAEYVKCVVRRIPAEREIYVRSAKLSEAVIARDAENARRVSQGLDPLPDYEPEADLVEYINVRIDSGPEAMAALICTCTDKGGNEALEARWLRHPRFRPFYLACKAKTEGQDPEGFSQEAADILWNRMRSNETPAPSSKSGGGERTSSSPAGEAATTAA